MPRVTLYEFCTATGLGACPESPDHSLWREGHAMRESLATDFESAGFLVTRIDAGNCHHWPGRLPPGDCVVIAPELDGHLLRLVTEARDAGHAVWAPDAAALRTASDKRLTHHALAAAGVPTPTPLGADDDRWPRVVKRVDGAGSVGVVYCESPADVPPGDGLHQEFVPGEAVSVAFLIGPGGVVTLPAARQRLGTPGHRFEYLGGEVPVTPDETERAAKLARHAVDAIPGLAGFVGVDLVLGARDVVIEVNPRLCTSYVGLRRVVVDNLARVWARLVQGEAAGEVSLKPGRFAWSVANLEPIFRADLQPRC